MENKEHYQKGAKEHYDLNQLFGYDVLDSNKESVGTIDNIWIDDTGQPAFFGVQTGWLGKVHVVPAHRAEINKDRQKIRLPHAKEKLKDAPSFDTSADLSREQEDEVYDYYGLSRAGITTSTPHREGPELMEQPQTPTHREKAEIATDQPEGAKYPEEPELKAHPPAASEEEPTLQLSEEEAHVRKHEKDAGGVRLRKVIRTETVHKPVELKHEDVEIERIPAEEGKAASSDFGEGEAYIPLRREEATLEKETHAKEQVKAHKKTTSEEKDLSEDVRKEDIKIERDDEERKYGT